MRNLQLDQAANHASTVSSTSKETHVSCLQKCSSQSLTSQPGTVYGPRTEVVGRLHPDPTLRQATASTTIISGTRKSALESFVKTQLIAQDKQLQKGLARSIIKVEP
jgi:hypothetical protein